MAMTGDADMDTLPDALEDALARQFYPDLNVHGGPFEGYAGGSRDQYYGADGLCGGIVRLTGPHCGENGADLPYVVQRVGPLANGWCENRECIEIVYGLPYASDLGNDFGGGAHRGDTEMYAVLLAYKKPLQGYVGPEFGTTTSFAVARTDAKYWAKLEEYAAAHRGDASDSSTLRANKPRAGGPEFLPTYLWVAEGKQGTYFSQSACNSGNAFWSDDCSDHRVKLKRETGVERLRNAGDLACHPPEAFDTTIPSPGPRVGVCGVADAYDVWSGEKYEGGAAFKQILSPFAVDWH